MVARHGHGGGYYDLSHVDNLENEIGDLQKQIRQARRERRDTGALEDSLVDLERDLRAAKRNDPLMLKKRERDMAKLEDEIHELHHKHPHKKTGWGLLFGWIGFNKPTLIVFLLILFFAAGGLPDPLRTVIIDWIAFAAFCAGLYYFFKRRFFGGDKRPAGGGGHDPHH